MYPYFGTKKSAQEHLSLTFADNDWSCKQATVNLSGEWELSTCSCKDWLKNYKYDHVIAVRSRLSKFLSTKCDLGISVMKNLSRANIKESVSKRPESLFHSLKLLKQISMYYDYNLENLSGILRDRESKKA
ncbi:hypothetical protein BpHYR1_025119 [Brachionus plicatilis]|uniref:Uncharacterized protein n=1 Tax=Brachionus plicatilis TaxID=10195 RepID=A0A3M7RRT1_BRAPC|nr:hypothetical protein BpHYR1_025119 [Brachionus plicatilis]